MSEAFAFESVTVGTAVASLNAALFMPTSAPPASTAFFQVTAGTIAYRIDGGTPSTPDAGMYLATTWEPHFLLSINEMRRFKAIRAAGSDAKMVVTYRR